MEEGGGVIVGKPESIYGLFFLAHFIMDIAVITCIKLLLKLTFYAHIKGQIQWKIQISLQSIIILNWLKHHVR